MAKTKILQEMQKAFGAKDLEATNGMHPVDFFGTYDDANFLSDFTCLVDDIRHACGGWSPPAAMDVYPPVLASSEIMDVWLPVWKLAYKDPAASVRGRPKTINILETTRNFLDNPFASQKNRISVAMPPGVMVGDPVSNFSIRHVVGFTRSLAAKLLCALATKANLAENELMELAPYLKAALYVKCTYETYDSEDTMMQKSILAKMIVAESTRPDVLQMFYSFSRTFAKQGLVYKEVIDQRIDHFNAQTSVDATRISDAERKMLKARPMQQNEFLKLLDFHWNQWKAAESATPLRALVKHLDRAKTFDSAVPAIWQLVLKSSSQKNMVFLEREIAIFLMKVKEATAAARGKMINLAVRAPKLRDANPDLGYDMACLWVHFANDFKEALGAAGYDKAYKQFLRGAFDREFTEKVRGLDEKIAADKFRFVSVLPGSATTVKSLAVQSKEAEEELENARLKAVSVKLAQEQKLWSDFLETLAEWKGKNTAERTTFLQKNKRGVRNRSQGVVPHLPGDGGTSLGHKCAGCLEQVLNLWGDVPGGVSLKVFLFFSSVFKT